LLGAGGGVEVTSNGDLLSQSASDNALYNTGKLLGPGGGVEVIHGSKEISFGGGPNRQQSERAGGLMNVVDAAARRRDCTARKACDLLFATQTGKIETVEDIIADKAGAEAMDAGDISTDDLVSYEDLIVVRPTWNTGADEYRSGVSWDDLLSDIKGIDLKGKAVAAGGGVEAISKGETISHPVSDSALKDTDKLLGAGGGEEVIRNGEAFSNSVSDSALSGTGKLLGTGGGVESSNNGATNPHSVLDSALRGTDKLLGIGSGVEVISNGESWSPSMLDDDRSKRCDEPMQLFDVRSHPSLLWLRC